MTDEQNKPVRSREAQVEALAKAIGPEKVFPLLNEEYQQEIRGRALSYVLEAEDRGAAEQRRKDGENSKIVGYSDSCLIEGMMQGDIDEIPVIREAFITRATALYTHPANVAALEDRVRELEEERDRLRGALIACGNNAGGFLSPEVSTDFLVECVSEEVRLKIAALTRVGTPS